MYFLIHYFSHCFAECLDYEVSFFCDCPINRGGTRLCDPNKPNTKHESDCHKFYQCQDDTVVEKSCGQFMMFNTDTQVCDWPKQVQEKRPECAGKTFLFIKNYKF